MTRTSILHVAAAVLCLGTAACVGTLEPIDGPSGGDDTGSGGGVARGMFDSDVAPMLGASCAGCHTGASGTTPLKFLGNTGATGYYGAITVQTGVVGNFVPANAALLNKGSHDNGLAPAWTTTESDTITMWLLAEADERGL